MPPFLKLNIEFWEQKQIKVNRFEGHEFDSKDLF
jgi:hypothetical protein